MVMDKIALLLVIIGAVNWGLIGIFQFDLVASIFGRTGRRRQPYHLYAGWRGGTVVHFASVPRP